MSKKTIKELKNNFITELSLCLNKKCKIVKQIEIKEEGLLLAFDPYSNNRLIFKTAEEKYSKIILIDSLVIYVEK